jgi:hypothetical protein
MESIDPVFGDPGAALCEANFLMFSASHVHTEPFGNFASWRSKRPLKTYEKICFCPIDSKSVS